MLVNDSLNLYIKEKIKVANNLPVDIIADVCELVWSAYKNKKTIA